MKALNAFTQMFIHNFVYCANTVDLTYRITQNRVIFL